MTEDNRLINWKKWLENRKRNFSHLQNITGRQPGEQLINSCETIRKFIEIKSLINEGNLPIPDKYRGDPNFWTIPESLPSEPEIRVTLIGQKNDFTYVTLPTLIRKEKHLDDLYEKHPYWEKSEYLQQRKDEIDFPNEPETDELFIQGKGVFDRSDIDHLEQSSNNLVLKIQNKEIRSDKFIGNIKWKININNSRIGKIIFENPNQQDFQYSFRRDDHSQRAVSVFQFAEIGIIPAGKIFRVEIGLRDINYSEKIIECWRLHIEPKIVSRPLNFEFLANDERFHNDDDMKELIIQQLLEELIHDIGILKSLPEPPYHSLFIERDIFLAKNPSYFYKPNLILELKDLYRKNACVNSPAWDLSLNDLKDVLLRIESTCHRRIALNRFNEIHRKTLRPDIQEITITNDKHFVIYNLLCSFFNIFEREEGFIKNQCYIGSVDNDSYIELMDSNPEEETNEIQSGNSWIYSNVDRDGRFYRDVLFIRIYNRLLDVIEQIVGIIESMNRLHEKYI